MVDEEPRTWADMSEDVDDLPPPVVTGPDEKGIKTVVSYKYNGEGKKVKVTRKYKVTSQKVKVNPRAEARKKWAKFGAAAGASKELEANVTYLADETTLDLMPRQAQDKEVDPLAVIKSKASQALWRIKQRQSGVDMAPTSASNVEGGGDDSAGLSSAGAKGGASSSLAKLLEGGGDKKDVYVPLHRRGGRGGEDGDRGDRPQRDDSCTVRVTNISEDARESDLRELFSKIGPIQRVYLAKDQRQMSKGYAFINYYDRSDAARAIEKLHGHGYDHLILNVEWAKPSNR